jgi:hypothetical protein
MVLWSGSERFLESPKDAIRRLSKGAPPEGFGIVNDNWKIDRILPIRIRQFLTFYDSRNVTRDGNNLTDAGSRVGEPLGDLPARFESTTHD